jgi:hypothetical protein
MRWTDIPEANGLGHPSAGRPDDADAAVTQFEIGGRAPQQIGGNCKDLLLQASARVVDRRLHRCSAASRDHLRGIVGAKDVVSPRQKAFLHEAARFDTSRLVVIAFRCRSCAMTKQAGRNANVGRGPIIRKRSVNGSLAPVSLIAHVTPSGFS